jgi:hypothetical protein
MDHDKNNDTPPELRLYNLPVQIYYASTSRLTVKVLIRYCIRSHKLGAMVKEEDTSDFVAFKQVGFKFILHTMKVYTSNMLCPCIMTQVFASISIVGSLVVLASLALCERWRQRMPPLKWILCAIGIFNLSSAVNYLYYAKSDDLTCRVQASMLQFFEVGSTLYAFVMALETNVLIGIVTNSLERLRFTMSSKRTMQRHLTYHSVIIMYGIATVLWMNLTHSYGGNGTWCWIERPLYRLYLFYIPTWISISAIMYLDIEVIRVVYKSYQQLRDTTERSMQEPEPKYANTFQSSESSSWNVSSISPAVGATATSGQGAGAGAATLGAGTGTGVRQKGSSAVSAKMLRVFMRMTLYPICLSLLVMPGSVVRVMQAGDFSIDSTLFRVMSIARNMCDPSFGTLNVIMWIFSDADVLQEWGEVLRRAALSCLACMHRDQQTQQQQQQQMVESSTAGLGSSSVLQSIPRILSSTTNTDTDTTNSSLWAALLDDGPSVERTASASPELQWDE